MGPGILIGAVKNGISGSSVRGIGDKLYEFLSQGFFNLNPFRFSSFNPLKTTRLMG
jgi:hypothetical protein